jgi:hypothetical protein
VFILLLLLGAVAYFIEAWMLMLAWGNVRLAWEWLPVMTYETALSVCLPLTVLGTIIVAISEFAKAIVK